MKIERQRQSKVIEREREEERGLEVGNGETGGSGDRNWREVETGWQERKTSGGGRAAAM